jgi:ornithine cyclodeaminase/alanine dehydrogenase-like protein (mu-crystallin family)
MVMDDSLLYLSEADVASAEIPLVRLRDAVAAVFAAQARGTAQAASKSVLTLGAGHVFQAKPGVMRTEGLAGMKWIGQIPPVPNGRQTISSLIVLSDLKSGAPVAVMGGDWITAARTAAMTAIAAQKLARADSKSIGFLGCGVQARSHFDALRLVLPGLKEVVACSRSAASAERFAAMARAAGVAARTTREPRQAVEGLDVVITTVPEGAEVLEFLDTAWVAPRRLRQRGRPRALVEARHAARSRHPCHRRARAAARNDGCGTHDVCGLLRGGPCRAGEREPPGAQLLGAARDVQFLRPRARRPGCRAGRLRDGAE